MMIDDYSLWAIAKSRHAEDLRAAEARRRADELPAQPSILRASISRWLHALANRIEPNNLPLPGIEPATAQAR